MLHLAERDDYTDRLQTRQVMTYRVIPEPRDCESSITEPQRGQYSAGPVSSPRSSRAWQATQSRVLG